MREVKSEIKQLFPKPWPVIWAWFYLAIIVLDLATPGSDLLTFIKLAGIFFCLFYVVQFFKTDRLLKIAMIMTSISDVILALNNVSIVGIVTFFSTQVIHLFRLSSRDLRTPILIFIGIAVFTIIGDLIWNLLPLLYVVCAFYALALAANITLSWHWQKTSPKSPRAFFALLGFLLFCCCDTCTAISYLSLTELLPPFLYAPANFLAWLFYYPSQVLISNSSKLPENQHFLPQTASFHHFSRKSVLK